MTNFEGTKAKTLMLSGKIEDLESIYYQGIKDMNSIKRLSEQVQSKLGDDISEDVTASSYIPLDL